MICLFEKDEKTFTGNGIAVLKPSECTVKEVAGGNYMLTMSHPVDEDGLYALITDERIIRAPVPPRHIPEITLPETMIWQTTESADLYSTLPATRRIPCPEEIKRVKQNPGSYAWTNGYVYQTGMLVTYNGGIYRAKEENRSIAPTNSTYWKYETTVAGSGDVIEYLPGTVLETLEEGVMISKIADYNADFIQARAQSGNVGYVARSKCEETETPESGEVIPAQDIREQPFRVFKIEYEDDRQSIRVEARHISYDFQGNGIYACLITNVEPMTAIAIMRGNLVNDDSRRIVTDIGDQTISADWSFLNPINALLDPDNGMVPKLGAALLRNNGDFYILSNANPRKGIRLAYGKNLLGVRWSQSSEGVYTRVLPRCGDGNNGNLFLDDIYVESDISSNYEVQRLEMMSCPYGVGDEYEKPDGTVITLTEETAKAQMEEDARKRFDIDKIDALAISLEVQFLLLGDTEEYAQYRGLESVCMYDEIEVATGKSGMTATAQVTEYEYDSILKRYKFIHAGDIRSVTKKISGYRMKKNSITYDKLGNDVITRIRSAQ